MFKMLLSGENLICVSVVELDPSLLANVGSSEWNGWHLATEYTVCHIVP